MDYDESPSMGSGKGLDHYVSLFWRKKFLILGVALATMTIAGLVSLVLPNRYTSTAVVIIEDAEIPPDLIGTTIRSIAERRLELIHQRIMTVRNLADVIERYGLYAEMRETQPIIAAVERMRGAINLEKQTTKIINPENGRPMSALISFELSYTSLQAREAQAVTRELARLYLQRNAIERRNQSSEVASFLETEAQRLAEIVSQLEARLTQFKRENPGFAIGQGSVLLDLITRTEEQIRSIDSQLSSVDDREILLRREMEITALPTDVEDQNAASPAQIVAEYERARRIYTSDHPEVIRLKALVDSIQSAPSGSGLSSSGQIADPAALRIDAQIQALNGERSRLQTERAALQQKLSQLEERAMESPQLDQRYLQLQRDYDNAKGQYDETRQKQLVAEQANVLEKSSKGERFTLLEPPLLPQEPSSPNRPIIVGAGFLFGFGSVVVVLFLMDFLDDRIHSPRQLEAVVGFQPLAMIPDLRSGAGNFRDPNRSWFSRLSRSLSGQPSKRRGRRPPRRRPAQRKRQRAV
ncbi:MAG: GumC family protein [Alphaproteobacteria bacterium]